METNHNDCRFYIPVDVFKGICMNDKKLVNADEASCERFRKAEKCKWCMQYTPEGEFTGRCGENIAYPDMRAKTCPSFAWISDN
jgi:4-hydroxyphenylacetate decarboxylase small subunit